MPLPAPAVLARAAAARNGAMIVLCSLAAIHLFSLVAISYARVAAAWLLACWPARRRRNVVAPCVSGDGISAIPVDDSDEKGAECAAPGDDEALILSNGTAAGRALLGPLLGPLLSRYGNSSIANSMLINREARGVIEGRVMGRNVAVAAGRSLARSLAKCRWFLRPQRDPYHP
jgi:hypothetical protein